jgi:hypothetical protein
MVYGPGVSTCMRLAIVEMKISAVLEEGCGVLSGDAGQSGT